MKHTLLAILLGLAALGLVIFGLSPASRADDNGVSLSFSADDNGSVITTGQTINFTAILTNTDAVSRAFIFAAQVPTGTVFVAASPDLQANSYPVGVSAADPVKSLAWSGSIPPQQPTVFTLTLQVASADSGPGGDIPVAALVFDAATGQELTRQTLTLDWPGSAVYLPLIRRGNEPTPTPTVSPSPTPTPLAGQITATIAGTLHGIGGTYDEAISGVDTSGTDKLYNTQPEHYWGLSFSLTQCQYWILEYHLSRAYFEFDTTGVGNFSRAYLEFRNETAYPGPPAHSVNIHQGTWTQLLTNTYEIRPENWAAYGSLIATVPGHTAQLPVTATVTIPATYINRGGMTKFVFRTSTEGTAPVPYSCMGGAQGLGGGVGLPYLYIVP